MLMKVMSVVFCMFMSSVSAAMLATPPEKPAADKKYVFFMHGAGLYKSYADSAREQWQEKVSAIESKGFIVISEERPNSKDESEYAFKVSDWVTDLLKKGVPAKNITVGGYSRGARVSIIVSDLVANSEVNYVLLAGCYVRDEFGDDMQGRILSIYDLDDKIFGSCAEAVAGKEGITFKEVELDTGYGHGMGKEVRDEWLNPMLDWIK